MKAISIYGWSKTFDKPPVLRCQLGWDSEKKRIIIIKGQRMGKAVLEEHSYLDKGTMKHIRPSHTLKFFKRIPYCIAGSYVWAAKKIKEIK